MARIRRCRLVVGSRGSRRPSIGVMTRQFAMGCAEVRLWRRALLVTCTMRGALRAIDGCPSWWLNGDLMSDVSPPFLFRIRGQSSNPEELFVGRL